ncbi:MAG: DUF6159 family protein [Myxococcota bacterium]
MNALSRSWQLTKLSFRVIGQDKELLLFPLIALLLSIGFLLALLYPTIWLEMSRDGSIEWDFANIVVTFISYLGLAFIGTFSNMCIVYTAKKRFEGGDATFGESISFALSRIIQILGWATVSASVGLLFRALDNMAERAGAVGEIVVGIFRSILGMVWSVITIFVVPSMVYRNTGPIDAIKDSVRVLRKTWGESLVRSIGFGLVQFLVMLLGVAAFAGLFATLGTSEVMIPILIVGAIVYFVGVVFVFMLAEMIFNTALYAYASEGAMAPGYTQELFDGAIRTK